MQNKIDKPLSCAIPNTKILDKDFWNNQYLTEMTKWDLGEVSPALIAFFDSIENKNSRILIPGCGNAYEAKYLLDQNFTDITLIDIAPHLVKKLQTDFKDNKNIKILEGDFFQLNEEFDIIIEQTFFCALPPSMRPRYAWKMHQLLAKNGILVGLLFNIDFEQGPPFGGSIDEYSALFKSSFEIIQLEETHLSAIPRLDTELQFKFKKNSEVIVSLYKFAGITCGTCKTSVSSIFSEIENVTNVAMSIDFKEVLVVSKKDIPIEVLREKISYEPDYQIELYR